MSPQAFRYHLPPRALRYHLSPGVSWYHLVSFVAQTLSWDHVPTNFPVPFVPPSSLVPFAPLASPLAPPPPSHSLAHARETGWFRYYLSEAAGFRYCHGASLFAFCVIFVLDIICLSLRTASAHSRGSGGWRSFALLSVTHHFCVCLDDSCFAA